MSDLALPRLTSAGRPTWRDAITPRARASRRRWTLIYPTLLCLYAWIAVTNFHGDGSDGAGTLAFAALIIIFGMLRRSTRRLTAIDHPDLDERDQVARNRAFRLAYPLLLAVLLLSVAALAFLLPDATRQVSADSGGTMSITGGFLAIEALIGLVLWLALWAVFLPTGVLAWSEPEALEPTAGAPAGALSEAARDGLLASALAIGLILGALLNLDYLPLLPFVAALMLVARLAHRKRSVQCGGEAVSAG
jgi:hypothetical protein